MAAGPEQEPRCAGTTVPPAAIIGHSIPPLVCATAQLSLNTTQLHLTLLLSEYPDSSVFPWHKTDTERGGDCK